MITYPSISGPTFNTLDEPCIAFHKYDGSNLRFIWNRQQGWHQFGTRHRWFNETNPTFGSAIQLFKDRFAQEIIATLRQYQEYRNITELVAFCEFFGPSTFSGLHDEREPKELVLFDIYLPASGFVTPHNFVQHFGHLPIAEVVYEGPFSSTFIEDVQSGKFPVNEGVVAKGILPKRRRKGKTEYEIWLAKVKTQAWMAELQQRAGESENLQQEFEENSRQQQFTANKHRSI